MSKDATVQNIINRALTKSSDSRIIHDTKVPLSPASDKPATPASGSSTDASFEEVKHAAAQKSPPPVPRKGSEIKLGDLIAPEVWAELLPKQIDPLPIDVVDNGAQAAAGTIITAPPPNDAVRFLDQTPPSKNLKILAAVCGVHDVTHVLQDRVRSDNTLSIPIKEISKLAESPVYDEIKKPFGMSLAFVYQIGNGPMRIRAAQFDGSSSVSVDVPNSPDDALVTPRQWSPETLSIASVVYGGVVFNSESILESIEKKVRDNYNKTAPRYHRVTIDSALVSPDPWKDVYKTGVVFFRAVKDGPIRAAVALESKDILLTDLSLLAVIHKEVIKEVEPPVPSNSKLRTNRIRLVGPPCKLHSRSHMS